MRMPHHTPDPRVLRPHVLKNCQPALSGEACPVDTELWKRKRRMGASLLALGLQKVPAGPATSYTVGLSVRDIVSPSGEAKETHFGIFPTHSGMCKLTGNSRSFSTEPISHMQEKPATLRLRGLSYRATTDDIAQFFEGYSLAGPPEEAIQLHRRMDGRPTGWASVYFETEQEARRAKQDKHRSYLHGRYIEIFINFETGELEWIHQPTLSENVNRKHHGKDNR